MNLLNIKHICVIFKLFISALCSDSPLVHYHNFIGQMDEVDSMCDQDSSFIFQKALKDVLKYLLPRVRVQGWDRIIHEDDLWALIHSSCKTYSCLLSAWEVNPLLSDFGLVSCRHHLNVLLKLTGFYSLDIFSLIEFTTKANIVSKLTILDPVLTFDIARIALNSDWTIIIGKILL